MAAWMLHAIIILKTEDARREIEKSCKEWKDNIDLDLQAPFSIV